MRRARLVTQSLRYHWRTNLAVMLGVAVAVAVLAGALIVGDSVRASLRDLFLLRLGNADYAVSAPDFFRELLAADIQNHTAFSSEGFLTTAPLIELEGSVSHATSGRTAGGVRIYGVDERFWNFHGRDKAAGIRDREVLLSESLARELESRNGDSVLIRLEKPSAIPVESLHGRKEDLGMTLRLTMSEALAADALGEFSVQAQQTPVRAAFISLSLLQKELGQEGRVNTILISESQRKRDGGIASDDALKRVLKEAAALEDYGIKLRALEDQKIISLERDSTFIDESLTDTSLTVGESLGMHPTPVLSYLANRIESREGAIPYSIVTAVGDEEFELLKRADSQVRDSSPSPPPEALPPIILNQWAARDLGVNHGAQISLAYYVWLPNGQLETKTARFSVAAVVPIAGLTADRDLVPDYPGISDSPSLADWNPPFPIDLKLIRKQDEDYWDQYRTTPKAFIPLTTGQQLWGSRFGKLTAIRLSTNSGRALDQTLGEYRTALQAAMDPAKRGLSIAAVRRQGVEASRGATNFGEYFLYFSFFLVISALLLTALFFKLGIEQRLREIGTLQALGFSASGIRSLFLAEGLTLAVAGSFLGLLGAVGYGYLILLGLRTWWVDAVGTTFLSLHLSPLTLLLGAAGGVLAALLCVIWTLRRLGSASTRSLIMGTAILGGTDTSSRTGEQRLQPSRQSAHGPSTRDKDSRFVQLGLVSWTLSFLKLTALRVGVVLSILGVTLIVAASLGLIGQTGGFFGGGASLLVALLCCQSAWLRRPRRKSITGTGWLPVSRLGFRNTTNRPGRSVLCIALIALSTFIIVAVDAFRRDSREISYDQKSGNGGFPLLAESLLPIVQDPNTAAGREALNIGDDAGTVSLAEASFTRFRLRPGDDASCLNLYAPNNPRILAATDDFIRMNRFAFQRTITGTKEEADNPWLLLNRELEDGVVPVIADANSMTYVLHLKLGEEFVLARSDGPVRMRLVGALADSVFQSEMIMAEKNFKRLFPEQEGYRFFLVHAPAPVLGAVTATLEDRLADFGFDVVATNERIAAFHRVENTYLSTFQLLGGLGLILGTLGMAAVLLRNVFERRRELALLRAVGYNPSHFSLMVMSENALMLFLGLATGTFCALLAIAPVFFERGGRLPSVSLGFLLLAVLLSGLIASLAATWAALRAPLIPALRAE